MSDQPTPAKRRRIRLLIIGPRKHGKTRLALTADSPAALDVEDSMDLYPSWPTVYRAVPATFAALMQEIRELPRTAREAKSIILDSASYVWDRLRAALARKKERDAKLKWNDSDHKVQFKRMAQELMDAAGPTRDVIVIAHEQAELEVRGKEDVREVGKRLVGDPAIRYHFDLFIRYFREGDRFIAEVIEARGEHLKPGMRLINPTIASLKSALYGDVASNQAAGSAQVTAPAPSAARTTQVAPLAATPQSARREQTPVTIAPASIGDLEALATAADVDLAEFVDKAYRGKSVDQLSANELKTVSVRLQTIQRRKTA